MFPATFRLRAFTAMLLVGGALLVGCTESRMGKKPELSKSQKEIVDRRKRHGKETTFTSQREDGSWRYSSKKDDWTYHEGFNPAF